MGSGFEIAFRRGMLVGLIFCEVIVVATASMSQISIPIGVVVLIGVLVCLTGVAALLWRAVTLVFASSFYASLILFTVIAQSPDSDLIGALIPITSWTVILPITLNPGARHVVASVLLSAMFAAVIIVAHPDWEPGVVRASVATNLLVIAMASVFLRFMRDVTAAIDRSRQRALDEQARAVRARALSEATAEYLRVLHDTIMNTFAVLARDDAARLSSEDVQARARRDAERIGELRSGMSDERRAVSLSDLDAVGLPVQWGALSGDDLARYEALIPVSVLRALRGCASEAILNATKHSGAELVRCDVSVIGDAFVVEITDSGRGFDVEAVPRRGLARSLSARAWAHGIEVQLESAPQRGTRVRLSYRIGAPSLGAEETVEVREPRLRHLELRMILMWTALSTCVGLVLQLPRFTSDPSSALLLMADVILAALTWAVWRRQRLAPGPPTVLLITAMLVAVPFANWCALAAVDYGYDAPYLFAALSLTVLPVLVYVSSTTQGPFVAVLVVYVLSTFAIAGAVQDGGEDALGNILLLQAPPLALIGAYYVFLRGFLRIGSQLSAMRRARRQAALEAVIDEAELEFHSRWSAPSLKEPLDLLIGISDGTLTVADPETRRRCAEEERYLRRLSEIPHESSLMGWWLAIAVAESRTRGVELTLNVSGTGIHEPEHAEAFGRLLLGCIRSTQRGAPLTINMIPVGGIAHMFIVARSDGLPTLSVRRFDDDVLRIRREQFSDQVLVGASVIPKPTE